MPKIKVKNILSSTEDRICNTHTCDSTCPLYKIVQLDDGDVIHCVKDCRYNSAETAIELSEKEFPTNREWMESLSNFELATLMTSGYMVKDGKLKGLNVTTNLMTTINEVSDWLSQSCQYLMEEE